MEQSQSDVLRVVARRLRQARLRAGLTQTELAQRLGRTQSLIADYESGTSPINLVRLAQIAAVLGVRRAYFVTESDLEAEVIALQDRYPDSFPNPDVPTSRDRELVPA